MSTAKRAKNEKKVFNFEIPFQTFNFTLSSSRIQQQSSDKTSKMSLRYRKLTNLCQFDVHNLVSGLTYFDKIKIGIARRPTLNACSPS